MQEKTIYYNQIKNILIDNEINKRVKDYSKNKVELESYYNVGKILSEAGKHYGEGIINQYSIKLTKELGRGYSVTNLKRMRQFFYLIEKGASVMHQLTWTHIIIILPLKDITDNKTIGLIVVKENNEYIIKYSSDTRIKAVEYSFTPFYN